MGGALYRAEDGRFVPSDLTVGPWSDQAQHGGPVAALLARAVEGVPSEVPMQTVRITIELMRPVPLVPLTTVASVLRPGKKVQLIEASMAANDVVVAQARALRIRTAAIPVPEQVANPASPPIPDASMEHQDEQVGARVDRTAFAAAVELRFVKGSWDRGGPATVWSRLVVPVVEGEEPSPLQRVAAVSDFGNGISRVLDFNTHMFINPDLTVSLSRLPDGEWVGLDTVSRVSGDGYGQAESLIFDRHGPIGRAVQSLFIDRRADTAI